MVCHKREWNRMAYQPFPGGGSWELTGYPPDGEVLRIGFNHRDQEGVSLRGWVAVDGYKGATQDFLAHPTPEPATLLLLSTGLLGGAAAFRKRLK